MGIFVTSTKDRSIDECLRQSFKAIDVRFKDASSIAIKPNLCGFFSYNSGIGTNPDIVNAAIEIIREETDVPISIVETDTWARDAEEIFKRQGYNEIAKRHEVELVNLSKGDKLKLNFANLPFPLTFSERLLDYDYLISIAIPKPGPDERYTGILKNQFGLMAPKFKSRYHPYMKEVLYSIYSAFPPDLSILDGRVLLDGIGPISGYPVKRDLILCSKDAIALDVVGASLYGFGIKDVPHLKYTIKKGLIPANLETIGDKELVTPIKINHHSALAISIKRRGLWLQKFGNSISRFGSFLGLAGFAWDELSFTEKFYALKGRIEKKWKR